MVSPRRSPARAAATAAATAAALLVLLGACADEPTAPSVTALVPGESRSIAGGNGSERIFSITVPEGTGTLQIRLTEGDGDADLIVRLGARPESGLADCVSETDGNEEECLFDSPAPGIYYILVYGYTPYSEVRLIGSLLAQSGATALTAGVPVEPIAGGAGSFRMYSIAVPAGTTALNVTLTATGDADLYVRRGGLPRLNLYECASYTETGNESCSVSSPESGTWFIRIEGYDPYSAGRLTVTFGAPPP